MTIERAAKAIWLSMNKDMEKAEARILARAALEAIAEPTEEMTEAGIAAIGKGCDITPTEARAFWRASHAAMMKEEK